MKYIYAHRIALLCAYLSWLLPLAATQPLRKIPLLQADGTVVYIDAPANDAHQYEGCHSQLSPHKALGTAQLQAMISSTPDGLGYWGQNGRGAIRSLGIVNIPVVLVEFQDVSFQSENDTARMSKMLNAPNFRTNEKGAQGSVRDYFIDQSYGQFTPNFHVLGKVRLSKPRAYYGRNSGASKNVNILEMNREALELMMSSGTDFSPFVENNNVPLVMFLHAGPGEHDSFEAGREDYIWAHFSETTNLRVRDLSFKSYFVGCELHQTYRKENEQIIVASASLAGIGVICHELSHALGLPDFYHTNTDTSNTIYQTPDLFDLMDYGQWMNEGHRPMGYSAYERSYMGWLRPTALSSAYEGQRALAPLHWNDTALHNATSERDRAYVLRNPDNAKEYFVFENRQPSKWYPASLAKGMLVYRVNYDEFDWSWNRPNNNATRLRYAIVPADNEYQNHKTPNVSLANYAGDFFGTNDNVRKLSSNSTTLFRWYNATVVREELHNISVDTDGYVRFDYTTVAPTAIATPTFANNNSEQCYDLSGRVHSTTTLPKGISIAPNGRKFIKP